MLLLESFVQAEKPVAAYDIDGVLFDQREINQLWLPGKPDIRDIPFDEYELAKTLGIPITELYDRKDEVLASERVLDIKPIEGSAETLAIISLHYYGIAVTARKSIPEIADRTKEHVNLFFGNIQEGGVPVLSITKEHSATLTSKEDAYRMLGAKVVIDDRPSHIYEAVAAGVPTKVLYDHGGGMNLRTQLPFCVRLAQTHEEFLNLVPLPSDSGQKRYNVPTGLSEKVSR